MLSITKELLKTYDKVEFHDRDLKLKLIARHGSILDAQELLSLYLMDTKRDELLFPIRKLGCFTLGEQLFERYLTREGIESPSGWEICHTIGYLGVQKAVPKLWDMTNTEDYSTACGACLGLVHLDCSIISGEIVSLLEDLKGQSEFHEFLPMLASKAGAPSWINDLFLWGDGDTFGNQASTDNNGGLIAGVALFGEKAKPQFEQLLWNSRWKVTDRTTGASNWAYHGVRLLKYRFTDLLQQIRSHATDGVSDFQLVYEVSVLLVLLDCHISGSEELCFKFVPEPQDSWRDLECFCDNSEMLISWDEDRTLRDFVRIYLGSSSALLLEIDRLSALIEVKIEQEMERTLLKEFYSKL